MQLRQALVVLTTTTMTILLHEAAFSSQSLPIQVGSYTLGSKYIQIAKSGNRICFQGSSVHGQTTASITPDPKHRGFYLIHGWEDARLYQQEQKTLFFGELNSLMGYQTDYESNDNINTDLQQCLNTTQPFYRQTLPVYE
jgi:hypothetical protein